MLQQVTIATRVLAGLEHHGYPVLFWSLLVNNVGVPVPAESVLLTAAGLAKEGHFRLPLVYLTGVAAACWATMWVSCLVASWAARYWRTGSASS